MEESSAKKQGIYFFTKNNGEKGIHLPDNSAPKNVSHDPPVVLRNCVLKCGNKALSKCVKSAKHTFFCQTRMK